ncbi:septation protein SepH [uncultured Agrococcus sp.]|uniref:septation protein SepH n=1 Tax=uncultured Agrococcus sp. TaxID=382258 RepID=UPI0025F0D5ED|nr:septation protein SepH [uncultured Agrococcus sp.]
MERLTVIGVEDDTLIVETPSGVRYGVAIDDLPRTRKRPEADPVQRKASPREIQTLIRQGMTAREVHERTGEDLPYIERFEGPVLAERQHILELAQRTPVASGDIDPLAGERTFEEAMRERLTELEAHDVEWLSWREVDRGWVIRLTFVAESRSADARWAFDRKKHALTPLGKEAKALSQSTDPTSVLVPRLRPVEAEEQKRQETPTEETEEPVASDAARSAATATEGQPLGGKRFDSGAFRISKQDTEVPVESAPAEEPAHQTRRSPGRASGAATEPSHTADLLDALRRRRTEREQSTAPEPQSDKESEEEDTPLFQVEEADEPKTEEDDDGKHHTSPLSAGKRKNSRAAMPSWDEIVFGSRSDD